MRTCVYVDAFNLYYGCLKGTPHRWLDISALCRHEMPRLDFQHFYIFAAKVKGRPSDPSQPIRQLMYFRALKTIPNLTLHYGRYAQNPVTMPLASSTPGAPAFARVLKSEEKGSDVNLASHLLLGAFRNEYDVAIVISNDSDLKEPIRIVTEEFHKPVIVLAPMPPLNPAKKRYIAKDLQDVATHTTIIDNSALPLCQFRPQLQDATGVFTKPSVW